MNNSCPDCTEEFDTIKGLRTHHGIVHDRNLENNTCNDCGERFYSELGNKKFCDNCFSFSGDKNPNYNSKKQKSNCEECNSVFYYYRSAKEGIYCKECQKSRPWVSKDDAPDTSKQKKKLFCDFCNDKIKRLESNINEHNFCSKSCQHSWLSKYYRGKNHPNWVEGYDSNYSGSWWSVKKKALKRDNYKCQICDKDKNEIGRNPDVHHIVPVRLFENQENAHKIDNVICLCPSCHKDIEPKDLSSKR